MKYIRIISKNGFILLGLLLFVYVVFYFQKALFWTTVTDDLKRWHSNDYQWLEFSGNQRDVFLKKPAFTLDVNLVQRDTTNQSLRFSNRLSYEENSMSQNSHELSSVIYGKGCRDNPFRNRLKKLLKYWTKLVKPYDIEYFLCYGSLLGYHRTGDVIPYDHDVDLCMNEKDFDRLANFESKRPFLFNDQRPHLIIQRNVSKGRALRRACNGTWVTNKVDPCSILSPPARVILGLYNFLDVYLFRADNRFVENPNLSFDRRDIYPVRQCLFMGVESRCPHNTTSLLISMYGADFAWNPHHVCRNGQWVATGKNVTERKLQWAIVIEDKKKRPLRQKKKRRKIEKF